MILSPITRRTTSLHNWHYFSLALQDAWPTLSRGLGV